VSLERGPLSLVSTIEELLGRKISGSGLEKRDYGRRYSSRRPRGIPYPQKLELTSPARGGRSVGIVRSRTQATEFIFLDCYKQIKSKCLQHIEKIRFDRSLKHTLKRSEFQIVLSSLNQSAEGFLPLMQEFLTVLSPVSDEPG
jgi:hypothetical protein